MIPTQVNFTGLSVDPLLLISERCIKGIIPNDWHRYRFQISRDATYPIANLNRWLKDNIEGRWAIHMISYKSDRQPYEREVTILFENSVDGVTFVLADGKTEAFKEPS